MSRVLINTLLCILISDIVKSLSSYSRECRHTTEPHKICVFFYFYLLRFISFVLHESQHERHKRFTKFCVLHGSMIITDAATVAPSMVDGNIVMGKVSILQSHMNMMTKSLPYLSLNGA